MCVGLSVDMPAWVMVPIEAPGLAAPELELQVVVNNTTWVLRTELRLSLEEQ